MQHIRPFFTAPQFEDDEGQTRLARLLINFLWGSIVIALVTLPTTLMTTDAPGLAILLHGCTVLFGGFSLVRVRRGHIKWVTLALPVTIGILMLVTIIIGSRPFNLGVSAGLIAVVFTGMIGRWRARCWRWLG